MKVEVEEERQRKMRLFRFKKFDIRKKEII